MVLTKENIIQVCSDYFNINSPQYAILVDGEWGEGKTYFWKYTLEGHARKQGLKTVYVSLNGIENVRSINELILIGAIPLMGGRDQSRMRSAFRFVTNSVNGVSKYFFKSGLSELFQGVGLESIDFSNYIICFDDLERCEVKKSKVFGLINNIVEHRGGKAIVLCNESEILNKDEEYDRIKEKTIGVSLRYTLDISEIVSDKISSYQILNKKFFQLIDQHRIYIITLIKEYNVRNLRTVEFFFHILKRVHAHLMGLDLNLVKEVILFSLLISIELKNGTLRSSDLENNKELDEINFVRQMLRITSSSSIGVKNKKGQEQKYSELFYDKFLRNRFNEYHFYKSLYTFILSGYLDEAMLANELSARIPPEDTQEAKSFRKLITSDFRCLTNDEFKNLSHEVIEYAGEGRYALADYVALAKFYAFFEENGLLDFSEDEMKSAILKGVNVNRSTAQVDKQILRKMERFTTPVGFELEVLELLKEIAKESEDELTIGHAEKLIELFRSGDKERLTEDLALKKFEMTYFHLVNMSELARVILQSPNDFLVYLRELFEDRYSASNISNFLPKDKDPLLELVRRLNEYLNNDDIGQPKKMIVLELIDSLSQIGREKY